MANNEYRSNISNFAASKHNKSEQPTQQPIQNVVDTSTADNAVDTSTANNIVDNPTDQITLEQLKKLLNIDDNEKIEVEDLTEKLVKYNEVDSNIGNQLYTVMVDESVADVSDRIEAIMNNTEIRANSFIPPVKRQKLRYKLVPKYIDRDANQVEINTIKDFNPMSIVDMQAPRDPRVRPRELDEYKYKLQVCLDILSHSNSDINKYINKWEQYKRIHNATPDLIKKADDRITRLKALKIRNEEIRKSIKNVVIPEIKTYDPSTPINILKMNLEEQLDIVNDYPLSLGLIPSPDRKTIITAIKKDPQSIICIPSPSPLLQWLAVKVGGPEMIRFIKPSTNDNRLIRKKDWSRDPKVIEMACKQDWRTIAYLNKWQQTEKIQRLVMSISVDAIKYIKEPISDVQKLAINDSVGSIKYINHPTIEIQKRILEQHPQMIKYIRDPSPEILKFAREHDIEFQKKEQPKTEKFEVNIDEEKYEKMKNKSLMSMRSLSIPRLLSNLMLPLSGETVKYKTWSLTPKSDLIQTEDLITNQYISKYIGEYRKAFLSEYYKSKKEMPTEFLPIRVSYLFSFKNQSNQQCPVYYIRVIDVRNYMLNSNGFGERIPIDNAEQKAKFIADFYKNKKNLTSIQNVAKTMKAFENSLSYTEALQSLPQFVVDEPTGDALVRKIQNMHGNTGAVVYIYNQSKKQLHTYARRVFTGKGRSVHLQKSNKRSYITSQSEFAIPINWLQSQLEKSEKKFNDTIYKYFFKAVKSGRLPGSFQNYVITDEVKEAIQAFNNRLELERTRKQRKKQAIKDKQEKLDIITYDLYGDKIKSILKSWFAENLKWKDDISVYTLPRPEIKDPISGKIKQGLFNFQKVWEAAGESAREKIQTIRNILWKNYNANDVLAYEKLKEFIKEGICKDWTPQQTEAFIDMFGIDELLNAHNARKNISKQHDKQNNVSTNNSNNTNRETEIDELIRLSELNSKINLKGLPGDDSKQFDYLSKKYPDIATLCKLYNDMRMRRLTSNEQQQLNNFKAIYADVYTKLERNTYKANLKQSKNIHERLSSLMTSSNVKMLSQYIKKKLSLNQTSKIQQNKITSILSTHVNNIIKQSEQTKKKDQKKKLLLDETNKQYEYNTIEKTLTILNLEYSYRDVFNIYSKFKNKTIDITNQSKKNLQKYFNEWFILYLQSVIRKYKKYIDSATIIRFSTLQKKDRYLQYNIQFKIQSEINKQIMNKNNRIRKIVYKIVKKISKKSINIDSIQYNLNKYLKLNSKKFRNIEI